MKENVHVCVDGDVWGQFKTYVLNKHGKLHGVLGEEVSRALELYLLMQSRDSIYDDILRLLRAAKRFNKSVTSIISRINEAEVKTLSEFGVI